MKEDCGENVLLVHSTKCRRSVLVNTHTWQAKFTIYKKRVNITSADGKPATFRLLNSRWSSSVAFTQWASHDIPATARLAWWLERARLHYTARTLLVQKSLENTDPLVASVTSLVRSDSGAESTRKVYEQIRT